MVSDLPTLENQLRDIAADARDEIDRRVEHAIEASRLDSGETAAASPPPPDGLNPMLQNLAGRARKRRGREIRQQVGNEGDFYRTPPIATLALLEKEIFPRRVYEPACGDGAISNVLKDCGYEVESSDLFDRGYGETGIDFLTEPARRPGDTGLIANPPFSHGTQFAKRALDMGYRKVALLCRVAFLEGQDRAATVFSDSRLSRVWVFSRRITLWRGDDPNPKETGGAMAFAWYIWENSHRGTQVGWL